MQINLKLKHLLHETGPNNKLKPNNLIKTLLDFDKTIECYQKHGLIKQWEQLPDNNRHNKEKTFLEKIKSKRTGEYYQAEDLIKRELVPAGWQPPHIDIKTGKPLKYPIKHVNEIIRKRLADGSEWLLSREMWTGLDQAGNPISVSFNDKQWFDAVFPYTKLVPDPQNPRDRDSKLVPVFDHIEHRPTYTLPFNEANLQKLYDMRNGRCALVLQDGMNGDKPPMAVDSFEAFKRPFDELWDMVTTPRYRMDRSYRDNLEATHIG